MAACRRKCAYERVAAGGRGVARSGSVASHREIRAKSAGAERRMRGFFEEQQWWWVERSAERKSFFLHSHSVSSCAHKFEKNA